MVFFYSLKNTTTEAAHVWNISSHKKFLNHTWLLPSHNSNTCLVGTDHSRKLNKVWVDPYGVAFSE